MTFNEADLKAVGKIQEDRGCTLDHAKAVYRKHVQKLANPDVENRAELVLASMERGVTVPSDDEVEQAATSKPRKLKAKKKNGPKAKAKKAAGSKKAPKLASTRVDHPLAELAKEVDLTPTDVNYVYTANLFGRKHVTIWAELDHATQGTASRFGPVDISQKRLEAARKYGKENELPVAICVTVRVGGRLDQGYAVPVLLFEKFKRGKKGWFTLSGAARKAYAEGGWDGVKFSEKAVAEKAA